VAFTTKNGSSFSPVDDPHNMAVKRFLAKPVVRAATFFWLVRAIEHLGGASKNTAV